MDVRRPAGFALDAVAVGLFVGIGRVVHEHGLSLRGFASTAWPFATGLVIGWLVLAFVAASAAIGHRRADGLFGDRIGGDDATGLVGAGNCFRLRARRARFSRVGDARLASGGHRGQFEPARGERCAELVERWGNIADRFRTEREHEASTDWSQRRVGARPRSRGAPRCELLQGRRDHELEFHDPGGCRTEADQRLVGQAVAQPARREQLLARRSLVYLGRFVHRRGRLPKEQPIQLTDRTLERVNVEHRARSTGRGVRDVATARRVVPIDVCLLCRGGYDEDGRADGLG